MAPTNIDIIQQARQQIQTRLDSIYYPLRNGERTLSDALQDEFVKTLASLTDLNRMASELDRIQTEIRAIVSPYVSKDTPQMPPLPQAVSVVAPAATPGQAQVVEIKPLSDPTRGIYVGPLERRPRGGYILSDVGVKINVAEARIADLGIEHGMIVQARDVGYFADGVNKKYFFTVIDPTGSPNPDRIEAFGPVEYYDSSYHIVKAGDVEILVETRDLNFNKGITGDVVKVAYLASSVEDNIVNGCVLRVMSDAELGEPAAVISHAKKDKKTETKAVSSSSVSAFIGSPRVLIIGGRNWRWWEQGLKKHGVEEPVYMEGFKEARNLEDAINGFDIVVIVKPHCSHNLNDRAIAECKALGKMWKVTPYENWSGFRNQELESDIIPEWNKKATAA